MENIFNSMADYKRHLEQVFAQKKKKKKEKDKSCWEGGNMKLPKKWQKVVLFLDKIKSISCICI